MLLEIGIGGYAREGQGGASLRMWKRYFPHAQIVGLDIEDKSFLDRPRITTCRPTRPTRRRCRDPRPVRRPAVVIDDGSHRPADILATFDFLFPLLPDGAHLRHRGHPDVVLAGVRRQEDRDARGRRWRS